MKRLSLQIENVQSEVSRLLGSVEEFGEKNSLPPDIIFDINLSLDELITNIVSYGFKEGEKSKISIDMELNEDKIDIELIDYGIEFDPTQRTDPDISLPIEERKIGGLGIFFVKQKMDAIHYKRMNDRNVLRLTKLIKK